MLKDKNNACLGVDLDNGGKDGRAVLFVPRQHLETVKLQLATYQRHQNPRMAGPNSFYAEFKEQASQIPETVFTENIRRLLNREIIHPVATTNEWIKPPTIDPVIVESRDPTEESIVTPTKAQERKMARKKALQACVGIIA